MTELLTFLLFFGWIMLLIRGVKILVARNAKQERDRGYGVIDTGYIDHGFDDVELIEKIDVFSADLDRYEHRLNSQLRQCAYCDSISSDTVHEHCPNCGASADRFETTWSDSILGDGLGDRKKYRWSK